MLDERRPTFFMPLSREELDGFPEENTDFWWHVLSDYADANVDDLVARRADIDTELCRAGNPLEYARATAILIELHLLATDREACCRVLQPLVEAHPTTGTICLAHTARDRLSSALNLREWSPAHAAAVLGAVAHVLYRNRQYDDGLLCAEAANENARHALRQAPEHQTLKFIAWENRIWCLRLREHVKPHHDIRPALTILVDELAQELGQHFTEHMPGRLQLLLGWCLELRGICEWRRNGPTPTALRDVHRAVGILSGIHDSLRRAYAHLSAATVESSETRTTFPVARALAYRAYARGSGTPHVLPLRARLLEATCFIKGLYLQKGFARVYEATTLLVQHADDPLLRFTRDQLIELTKFFKPPPLENDEGIAFPPGTERDTCAAEACQTMMWIHEHLAAKSAESTEARYHWEVARDIALFLAEDHPAKQQPEKNARRALHHRFVADARAHLGLSLIQLGEYGEGLEHLKVAEALARKHELSRVEATCLLARVESQLASKDWTEAFETLGKARKILSRITTTFLQRWAAELSARLAADTGSWTCDLKREVPLKVLKSELATAHAAYQTALYGSTRNVQKATAVPKSTAQYRKHPKRPQAAAGKGRPRGRPRHAPRK